MKTYKHGRLTPGLNLPAYGPNDTLDPDIEYEKLRALENALMAATRGVKNAVFDEGRWSLLQEPDGEFSFCLNATGTAPSLRGVVAGAYFEAAPLLVWPNLATGKQHWLYVTWTSGLANDWKAVRPLASTIEKNPDGKMLLVATVDLRADPPGVDLRPPGKAYSWDIASHALDSESPHGTTLVQEELVVRRQLRLELAETGDVPVDVDDRRKALAPLLRTNGELLLQDKGGAQQLSDDQNRTLKTQARSLVGAVNELAELRQCIAEAISGGSAGVAVQLKLPEPFEVVFVQAVRLVEKGLPRGSLGEVSFMPTEQGLTLYNNGDTGLKFRLLVTYR